MISYLGMKYRYILLFGILSIFFSIIVFNSFNYKHISYNQNKILNDVLLNDILGIYKDSSNIDIEEISSILDHIDILNSYNIIKSVSEPFNAKTKSIVQNAVNGENIESAHTYLGKLFSHLCVKHLNIH